MLRFLVMPALLMVASPAFAGGDDFLKQIFDADGPTITDGQPTGEQVNDQGSDDQQMDDGSGDSSSEPEVVDDPACPADRYGNCPELLTPEERADYDAGRGPGVAGILMSPFERGAIDRAMSDEPPVVDDPPSDDEQVSDEPSADDPGADDPGTDDQPPADDPPPTDDEPAE